MLEKKNIALSELVEQVARERSLRSRDVSERVEKRILPLLARLPVDGEAAEAVKVVRRSLRGLASPLSGGLALEFAKLSPRELEICDMIRSELSSKEIARTLGVSIRTVETQRKSIRRKLQLKGKDANLSTFLKSRL